MLHSVVDAPPSSPRTREPGVFALRRPVSEVAGSPLAICGEGLMPGGDFMMKPYADPGARFTPRVASTRGSPTNATAS